MAQLTTDSVSRVLEEYLEKYTPAMLQWRYHLVLVKGGPEYAHLPEQSHFAHIISGVFGLIELVRFIVKSQVFVDNFNEDTLRKALALFTIHEVHKAWDYEKIGSTEFSIPLERLREEYERLGLSQFAAVDEHLMRNANVHKRSTKHGDPLLSEEDDGSLLWLLVRIADTFASVKTPAEAVSSLISYLKKLGPAFAPKNPPGQYRLYYHEIQDVRGILTNSLHAAISQRLEKQQGLYPLLFFPTGTLYIGPASIAESQRATFIQEVVTDTLGNLTHYGDGADAIRMGQRAAYFDFETFVYSFASVPTLLELVRDDTISAKVKTSDITKDFDSLLAKKDLPVGWTAETVDEKFTLTREEPKEFLEHWARARRYLFYVDKIVRELNPSINAMDWFLQHFAVSEKTSVGLQEVGNLWAKGGPGKYVLPIAYHFLRGKHFIERPAEALTPGQVVNMLHEHVLAAMGHLDTKSGREAAVTSLGFRQDLTIYLAENLYLSFAPETNLEEDALTAYSKPKNKNPKTPFCALCGRSGEYVQEGRTGILDDFLQVFSNRMLPVQKVQGNRSWCPTCHLEFILRKLTGMGLPSGAHYKSSYRIFLYVMPTFSFTQEHLRLYRRFLSKFANVTSLPVRDFGKEFGLPHHWLERRELDPDWMDALEEILTKQAEKIVGWGGRSFVGERISIGNFKYQPHYFLITWEKPARETEKDDARIATRTEAWAKALFSAAIITGFTSCKVYVTERPYLPVSNPAELKTTITLDGPPPMLRGMLDGNSDFVTLYGREKGERSGLERVLDLSAALWTITTSVHPPDRNTKDKHIAGRLSLTNVSPLAGAHFYKEYSRLNEGKTPSSPLDIACDLLLEIYGGDLMDLVEHVSQQALAIRLPFRSSGRGKVHNYELTFREGVSALRKAFALVPTLRETAITGKRPPVDGVNELKHLASGTLLKAMERRITTRRGDGVINPWRGDLNQLTYDFINTLVDEVYLNRADGSFARFLRLENSLADGVYYYTDRYLSELWQQYNEQKAERQAQEAIQSSQS